MTLYILMFDHKHGESKQLVELDYEPTRLQMSEFWHSIDDHNPEYLDDTEFLSFDTMEIMGQTEFENIAKPPETIESLTAEIQALNKKLLAVYEAGNDGIGYVGQANYQGREDEAQRKLDEAMYGEGSVEHE